MADRFLPHLQNAERGELVALERIEQPLLPYERALIKSIGISEQEYREFFRRVVEASERPLGYEHIPDIVNAPAVPVLINLAIGLVLTGIGALLAPKPPQPSDREQRQEGGSITLSSQQGRTRFNQTVGFDGVPQLAQLGSRIPLIFGKRRNNEPSQLDGLGNSGGIIAEPLLVWSQVLSKGTYQNFKGVYIIGERGIERVPDREGFLMGGQPIDDIYDVNYEIFFSSKPGGNILNGDEDSVYGTAAPGDDEIFVVPEYDTNNKVPGFSMAYSPNNKSVFGVSAAHRNGGRYSLNWRVISLLNDPEEDGAANDSGGRLRMERAKIAGSFTGYGETFRGMKGTGRWYSPQMGLYKLNNEKLSEFYPARIVTVKLGDIVSFQISNRIYVFKDGDLKGNAEDLYEETDDDATSFDDIVSAINSHRSNADDAMNPGEIFVCNQTLLQVQDRVGSFEPAIKNDNTAPTFINLKVIGFIGKNHEIGLCGFDVFKSRGVMRDGERTNVNTKEPLKGESSPNAREANWYSLVKADLAQVKNTRACEITEIGIKSQVYTRINGLCNFANVPRPTSLNKADVDGVQITSGTTNKYTKRTSFFMLGVKTANDNKYQGELVDGYDIFEEALFAIQGEAPVDQFNFLRIKPSIPDVYEYRLIPVTATHVYRYMRGNPGRTCYILDVNGKYVSLPFKPENISTTFAVECFARLHQLGIGFSGYDPVLDLVEVTAFYKGRPGAEVLDKIYKYSDPTYSRAEGSFEPEDKFAHKQAYYETVFGPLKNPDGSGGPPKALFGERRSRVVTADHDGNPVNIRMTAVVWKTEDANFIDAYGTMKSWAIESYKITDEEDKQSEEDRGDRMVVEQVDILNKDGWYWNFMGKARRDRRINFVFYVDVEEKITGVSKVDMDDVREWENYAQIKEVSAFDEITRSCDNGPEHEIIYVNESDSSDGQTGQRFEYPNMTVMGIKLKSMNQTQQLQQMQVYLKDGISIPRLNKEGEPRQASDLLGDIAYFLLTEDGRGLKYNIPPELIAKKSFKKTNEFLRCYELRYNGAISDQVNFRTYMTQIAPYFLVNFSIQNGKFHMSPAVPVDNAGKMLLDAVPIKQYFNDGNIVDGSFNLNYIDSNERRDFRCVIKYRTSKANQLPEIKTLQAKFAGPSLNLGQEEYDLSQYVTTEFHARMVAKYLLSIRRRIDHTIEFQTVPQGLDLSPGDYIKTETLISPIESRNNAVVSEGGKLLSGDYWRNGTYPAFIYRQGSTEVIEEEITIENGYVTDVTLEGALLNIPITQRRLGVYMVEEIQLEETGMVSIKASHHPVFDTGASKIVDDILKDEKFTFID